MEISTPEELLLRASLKKDRLSVSMHFSTEGNKASIDVHNEFDHRVKWHSAELFKIFAIERGSRYDDG